MTNRARRYYSRKTQATRVAQLVHQVDSHPHRGELIGLIQEQVSQDTYRVLPQVFHS